MSEVPYTTQVEHHHLDGLSQDSDDDVHKILVVHTENMTDRQRSLISTCLKCLNDERLMANLVDLKQLELHAQQSETEKTKYFVVPSREHVGKIRSLFSKKARIYLPRCVIEAISLRGVALPIRWFAVSMTMHDYRIFLGKSVGDSKEIKIKIFEMSGRIASDFDEKPNVLVAKKADDLYCARAFKENIPVVSVEWIESNYPKACEEDESSFGTTAMVNLQEFKLKPFTGLYLKLCVEDPGGRIAQLIKANGGRLVYGEDSNVTHLVVSKSKPDHVPKNLKTLEIDRLEMCVEQGRFIRHKDLKAQQMASKPVQNHQQSSNEPMPPPKSFTRPLQPKTNSMNDIIQKALSTFEPAQTQHVSTQIRRLPEAVIQIEQTYEPSQQLFWRDRHS